MCGKYGHKTEACPRDMPEEKEEKPVEQEKPKEEEKKPKKASRPTEEDFPDLE